jgi:phenylacetate-CoA ligase
MIATQVPPTDSSQPDADSIEAFNHPTLSDQGRSLLRWMREHPNAPRFTGHTGSRLCTDDLVRVQERATVVLEAPGPTSTTPMWLQSFVDRALTVVPFFRRYKLASGTPLSAIPTTNRKNLSADVVQFVPDDIDASELITYVTSGTTGHPLSVPSHPRVAAEYLAYHRRALHRLGMDLEAGLTRIPDSNAVTALGSEQASHSNDASPTSTGEDVEPGSAAPGSVGVVLLGFQKECFTYTSVVPTQGEAGLVKLNLHPSAWRSESDRGAYLEALNPEVIAGDPISFAELLRIAPACRPRVLFSTSMTLLPGLRSELEGSLNCPVLDFYSMNEAGPIGVFDRAAGGHVLLQPELNVELLDPSGNPVADGERGEITLTGGFNVCLPLLRYRTGDFASMGTHRRSNGRVEQVLVDLAGREPARFCTSSGEWINNVDILHAFNPLTLSQFCLHQSVDGSLTLSIQGSSRNVLHAQDLLRALMGSRDIALSTIDSAAEKIKQFTSDFPDAMGAWS